MDQSERAKDIRQEDFASLWESETNVYDYIKPRRGELREGIILEVRPGEIIVDIGVKKDAVVLARELETLSQEDRRRLKVGAKVAVCVLRADDRDDSILVSIKSARELEDWQRAEELLESGEIVTVTVSGYNKGGLLVDMASLQGFVPASQIGDLPQRARFAAQGENLSELIGKEMAVKVIEVNRRRRRLILSERNAMREWRAQQRERLLAELKTGEVRRGTVSSLRDFGAFVDLGGVDGLVHLSELSWARVNHPSDILRVGDVIDVMVLNIDHEAQRIGLSYKRTQPDPWDRVADKYEVGQLVTGKVTHLVKFGAFVELEPGVEGLVHSSELAAGNMLDPEHVVSVGDELDLLVLNVDAPQHRIGLSLRQVPEELEEESKSEPADASSAML